MSALALNPGNSGQTPVNNLNDATLVKGWGSWITDHHNQGVLTISNKCCSCVKFMQITDNSPILSTILKVVALLPLTLFKMVIWDPSVWILRKVFCCCSSSDNKPNEMNSRIYKTFLKAFEKHLEKIQQKPSTDLSSFSRLVFNNVFTPKSVPHNPSEIVRESIKNYKDQIKTQTLLSSSIQPPVRGQENLNSPSNQGIHGGQSSSDTNGSQPNGNGIHSPHNSPSSSPRSNQSSPRNNLSLNHSSPAPQVAINQPLTINGAARKIIFNQTTHQDWVKLAKLPTSNEALRSKALKEIADSIEKNHALATPYLNSPHGIQNLQPRHVSTILNYIADNLIQQF